MNRVLEVMETIDDDCDDMDIVFVSVKVHDCLIGKKVPNPIIHRINH